MRPNAPKKRMMTRQQRIAALVAGVVTLVLVLYVLVAVSATPVKYDLRAGAGGRFV